MSKPLIVGNWKENKSLAEALGWLEEFHRLVRGFAVCPINVVLCPSYLLLEPLRSEITRRAWPFSLKLGAQDVSRFGPGAQTGEVAAAQLGGLADYVIIGHSERRRFFSESSTVIGDKLAVCFQNKLKPILCLGGLEQLAENMADLNNQNGYIVAYEPPGAISTGGLLKPERPEDVLPVIKEIKKRLAFGTGCLYGGSVSDGTVAGFLRKAGADGVLVGKMSLAAADFTRLLAAVSDLN